PASDYWIPPDYQLSARLSSNTQTSLSAAIAEVRRPLSYSLYLVYLKILRLW
ncbi:hypothetical protein LINPERHAP1_LOCUS34364, partial [Linum perenne]